MLLQWVGFGGGLLLALAVHELGHLLAARCCGVKVVSFSIGLGPELFAFNDQFGTRWRLGVLPLGASVGMWDRPSPGTVACGDRTDLSAAFSSKSIKQRAMIFLAGPIFSFLLASGLAGMVLILCGSDAIREPFLTQCNMAVLLAASGLSLFIGAFNLLPLLPLDGGRLLFLGIEAFRTKPVPDRIQTQLSRAGLIAVLLLAALLGLFWTNGMMHAHGP